MAAMIKTKANNRINQVESERSSYSGEMR